MSAAACGLSWPRSGPRTTSTRRAPTGRSRLLCSPAASPRVSSQLARVGRVRIERVHGRLEVMHRHVARARDQQADLLAIAAIVWTVVVRAQSVLARPRGEQHELAGIIVVENAKAQAALLAVGAIGQLAQQPVQLGPATGEPMHVGREDDLRVAHAGEWLYAPELDTESPLCCRWRGDVIVFGRGW